MKFSFRKIQLEKDIDIIFNIDRTAYNREFDYPAKIVDDSIQHSKGCIGYLCYLGNMPVGMIYYHVENSEDIEIKSLAVVPQYRHKGIGKKLLQMVLNDNPNKKFCLVTHPKNKYAIILYLKSGFWIYGWKDNYWGDGEPRLLLRKNTNEK